MTPSQNNTSTIKLPHTRAVLHWSVFYALMNG